MPPFLSSDPALLELVKRRESLSASGDDRRQTIEGLVQAMGLITMDPLTAQLYKLAAGLIYPLPPCPQHGESALLRILLNADELQECLAPARAKLVAAGHKSAAIVGVLDDLVTNVGLLVALQRLTEMVELRERPCGPDLSLLGAVRGNACIPWA